VVIPYRFARFERHDPARNVARFYLVEQRTDLWGQPAVVASWGRIGGKAREIVRVHPDADSAALAVQRAAQIRERRGYSRTAGGGQGGAE
jgi:predicted DNA-binding WGR domain protein